MICFCGMDDSLCPAVPHAVKEKLLLLPHGVAVSVASTKIFLPSGLLAAHGRAVISANLLRVKWRRGMVCKGV